MSTANRNIASWLARKRAPCNRIGILTTGLIALKFGKVTDIGCESCSIYLFILKIHKVLFELGPVKVNLSFTRDNTLRVRALRGAL